MILVDVGNSFVHFAIEKQNNIIKTFSVRTKDFNINFLEKRFKNSDSNFIICSVVPKVTNIFRSFKTKKIIIGKDLEVPIKNFYNKKHIGMDRLVGAFAAKSLYPNTRIVIDFGTAITFDFLSKKGAYLGGFIIPGIGSSLASLEKCAMLPKKIKLKKTKVIIPKDTDESISKGLIDGFSLMINSLVEKYKKILGILPKENIILTGKDTLLIKDNFNFKYIYEPFLIFKGLIILKKYARI